MLLDHVGPLVDSLEVEYVHLTPWSLDLKKISVGYRGGQFRLQEGTVRFGLFSLFLLNLNIKTLALEDISIDLEAFSPPKTEATPEPTPETTETGPFPGVLASLEHGLSYTLEELRINATVRLPGQQSLTVRVEGGGIKPKANGAIKLTGRFHTGKENDYIDLDGEVTLDQLTRGKFAAIETVLAIKAALAELPEPERINVNLVLSPLPANEDQEAVVTENGEESPFTREALHLALLQTDTAGNHRSSLKLDGTYNGNTGDFDGDYRVMASERLVQPYVRGNVLPPTRETLTGELNFNIATLTGDITVISELLVTELKETQANEQLPDMLRLENNFRLALLPDKQLRIETLDTGISDEAENHPLVSKLPADLNIPLDDIDGFLKQEQTLLAFELPRVPMKWLDVLFPEQEITDGYLTAAFRITTDTNSTIHLLPVKPLEIHGLTIKQEETVLVEGLNLSVMPVAAYSGTTLSVLLDKLVVDTVKRPLVTANFKAILGLSEEHKGTIKAQVNADLNTKNLIEILGIEQTGSQTMPRHFTLNFQTALQQQPGLVVVHELDVNLAKDTHTRLLNLQLLQPLVIENSKAGNTLRKTAGKLATLNISDILLEWFSPFVPDTTLQGKLHSTDFVLAMDAQGVMSITSAKPLTINHVTVAGKDGPLLEDLGISLRPTVRLSPKGTDITYKDFSVTSGSTSLVAGNGTITLPASTDTRLMADGRLDVDVQGLSQQPALAKVLQDEVEAPVRLVVDYQLAQGKDSIDINRLAVNLFYSDPEPKVSLRAESSVRVRTQLDQNQAGFGRAQGRMTLTVANVTPEPFAGILAANGLVFDTATGKAALVSDGTSLTVDTIEPFVMTGIEVKADDSALLNPFTLTANIGTAMQGDTLHVKLNQFSIDFDQDTGTHALDGTVALTLKSHDEAVIVENLSADLTALLPAMLNQPAILPDHNLMAGELHATMTVGPDGQINSTTRVQGLQGKEELSLQEFEMQVDGHLNRNGDFTISAPITITGKSGDSDIRVQATHITKDGVNNDIAIVVDSSVFYLNDILNTLNTISGKAQAEASGQGEEISEDDQMAGETMEGSDQQPDKRAFWDRTAYDAQLQFTMDHLFYTEYLKIHHIKARAEFMSDRLSLKEFEAHFHDSPLKANGEMTFMPGALPYDATLQASVEHLDFATFFQELKPDSSPRAEGLFDFNLEAFGQSPNLSQYRNRLFFDLHLLSRDGIFRLLDPESALVTASSGFAGGFGEVASYLPTGLFGLGAVSRLVNYIKDITYDKIEVHIVRDESRDVQIKRYVVQSPDILLTAQGGIEYQEGVDILRSPLSMEAQLDLRGRGAAIMYDLDLLHDEPDSYGYQKGPALKFWGTLGNAESNLEDIISTAGSGAVLGGITSPISGLIGNIKYLWFGDDKEPIEYQSDK